MKVGRGQRTIRIGVRGRGRGRGGAGLGRVGGRVGLRGNTERVGWNRYSGVG